LEKIKPAVIGLGYVGLPLAIAISDIYEVVGYDIDEYRISSLKNFEDKTKEITSAKLRGAIRCKFSNDLSDLETCNLYIITVPTPINPASTPDLSYVRSATEIVSKAVRKGDIIVYESTVYPGATEEFCGPLIEEFTGLKLNADFYLGYSPERINPGDKVNTITNIKKVTSGSTPEIALKIDDFYKSFIKAGTYKASAIKVAEAAKVIENTQRDVNIALINELSQIFHKMNIDTLEVLEAAGTKWNFLPFRPGLVGGHCIGVDPYYIAHAAQLHGHDPNIILSGRKINNEMSNFIVQNIIKSLFNTKHHLSRAKRVLIMGATFKENCPDCRNSKIIDIYNNLLEYDISVEVFDPIADKGQLSQSLGKNLISKPKKNHYDLILIGVAHSIFCDLGIDEIKKLGTQDCLVFDIKGCFKKSETDWRL
jgi:UDP-N-acetyl-D-galactosamine dehydrogenase